MLNSNPRRPVVYHTRISEATKDAPAKHRVEARYTGGNVLFAADVDRDKADDLTRQIQANPTAYGF